MKLLIASFLVLKLHAADPNTPAPAKTVPTDEEFKACLEGPKPQAQAPAQNQQQAPPAPPPTVTYEKVDASELPDSGTDGDLDKFRAALEKQVAKCQESPEEKNIKTTIKIGCRTVNRLQWCIESNKKMIDLAKKSKTFKEFSDSVKKNFDAYKMVTPNADEKTRKNGDVLFTAYNNPVMEISEKPDGEYKYPLYRTPTDLVQIPDPENPSKKVWRQKNADGSFSPYPDRAQIAAGALRGKGLEIGYAKSPLDISLLQVEGSGSMMMKKADGTIQKMQFNYDAQNGRKSYMLSKIMKCKGLTPADYGSGDKMRAYFAKHPEDLDSIVNANPSYVFFQPTSQGAMGSSGLELTARHSIATDTRFIPTGAVTFMDLKQKSPMPGCESFSNLAIAQDIGGAIKNAHVDTYWGEGACSDKAASDMSQKGSLYVMLPQDTGGTTTCDSGAGGSKESGQQ